MSNYFGNITSDQNLSNMFELNSHIINDIDFKEALKICERAYTTHARPFENEESRQKIKDVLRNFYLKSLHSDSEYIIKTGKVLFSTCLNMCLNLLISSLILSITSNFPIALIAFSAISYKLILNSITKNNVIDKQYLDEYEIEMQKHVLKKHSEFEINTSYSDQSMSDKTDSEGQSSYSQSSRFFTTPERERKPRNSCDTPDSDGSGFTDRESFSLLEEELNSPDKRQHSF